MSKAIQPGFFSRTAAACLCWGVLLGIPISIFGQTNYYAPNGSEYAVVGSLPGDQVFPDVAVNAGGGFMVWQDNATDGSGQGVSARRLDSTLSGTLGTFRVNVLGTNDQEKARVALLKGGGAVFAWEGGPQGQQHIYTRFLTPTNTWMTTNDVLVSPQVITNFTYATNLVTTITTNFDTHRHIIGYTTNTVPVITTNTIVNASHFQIDPAVAVLSNSNVVVVWASFNEAGPGSMQDVYGQILSPTGQKLGGEFLINQFVSYNQRTPAVAALANGGFVVTWVSEQERVGFNLSGMDNTNGSSPIVIGSSSVDVFTRLYANSGQAQTGEILVNTNYYPCANPSVAAAADGGFAVAWGVRDLGIQANAWDVYTRSFSSAGVGGTAVRVNSYLPGSQYAPRISAIGTDYLIVWTSLSQDGSREGVYGQLVHSGGLLVGGEFRANTTTASQQMHPVVASDGASQFLVVWTSYTGGPNSFDLFAQRYANVGAVLPAIADLYVSAPFVIVGGTYQPRLQVSWPVLLGISVSQYEIYVDGAASPMALTTNNCWTMTATNGLTASSTHSFRVDYVTTDARTSPLSPSVSGTTWSGDNYNGIPFEWMKQYYGQNFANWPVNVNALMVPGGMSLYQVFVCGGNPLDPSTWLKTTLTRSEQGMFLSWNTRPGFIYQVQVATNLTSWIDVGSPRFAAGTTDSMYVGGSSAGFYRIVLVR
jgi:hypothetical protein